MGGGNLADQRDSGRGGGERGGGGEIVGILQLGKNLPGRLGYREGKSNRGGGNHEAKRKTKRGETYIFYRRPNHQKKDREKLTSKSGTRPIKS